MGPRDTVDELGYTSHDPVEMQMRLECVAIHVSSTAAEIYICLKVAYFSRATFERQLRDGHGTGNETRLSRSQEVATNRE